MRWLILACNKTDINTCPDGEVWIVGKCCIDANSDGLCDEDEYKPLPPKEPEMKPELPKNPGIVEQAHFDTELVPIGEYPLNYSAPYCKLSWMNCTGIKYVNGTIEITILHDVGTPAGVTAVQLDGLDCHKYTVMQNNTNDIASYKGEEFSIVLSDCGDVPEIFGAHISVSYWYISGQMMAHS